MTITNVALPIRTLAEIWGEDSSGLGGKAPPGSFAFALLGKSGNPQSVTASALETVLATINMPANLIGANGQMRIKTYWTVTNSANTKTLRARIGGLPGTAIFTATMSTVANVLAETDLIAQNSTSSQFNMSYAPRGTDGLLSAGFQISSAIDMTTSNTLVITGQLATTSETITLNGYSVEYAN